MSYDWAKFGKPGKHTGVYDPLYAALGRRQKTGKRKTPRLGKRSGISGGDGGGASQRAPKSGGGMGGMGGM